MKPRELVDHFFRNEYGKAVSLLTARFGTIHLELAEDAVHDALEKAMHVWGYGSIPSNPTGWILRVAGNRMIDQLRRNNKIIPESLPVAFEETDITLDEINDDLIRMIFACCHPSISEEYQIILTLKILGGLSIREIATCLLKKQETIAKAYTRAKKKFKTEAIKLLLPPANEIERRLEMVLKIIYLLFNEGYKSAEGVALIKEDLCEEAMRLNHVLLDNEICNTPSSNALMALMYFNASRFSARVDNDGNMLNLETQDRNLWDKRMIQQGIIYLQRASATGIINEYVIQATINSLHCTSASFKSTNWLQILELYDLHVQINPNPIIELNRVIPLEKVHGSMLAFAELDRLEQSQFFDGYYLFYAIKAGVLENLHQFDDCVKAYQKAIALTKNEREVRYLQNRLAKVQPT